MLHFTRHQQLLLAEKLLDGANIAVGAMVFGQFVAEREFSVPVAALGLLLWIALVGSAIRLSKEMQ